VKILFAAPHSAWSGFLSRLEAENPEHELMDLPDFNAGSLAGFDIVIPTMTRITAEHIATADRLKLIQQVGAGVEGVDVDAARRAGIAVANVPSDTSGNAESVAEMGIYLMIALARRAREMRRSIKQGVIGSPFGMALKGKTVGILGLGGIGKALVHRLRPFGVKLHGIKRHNAEATRAGLGLDWAGTLAELEQLLATCDFVVVALPDTPETHGLIGARELGAMKPEAFLINLGRGGLVNREALLEALDSGAIAGAGLDVFWQEPPEPDDPVFRYNVIATPHVAGATDISVEGILEGATTNIRRLAAGQPILNRIC